MAWYAYLAYFFAGVFLANGIPHFVHGISGKEFSTPFAKHPGSGNSSPVLNVIWGAINFMVGYILIFMVGQFEVGLTMSALVVGLGGLITAVGLAISFGRERGS